MMKLSIKKYRFIPIFIVLLTVLFNDNTLIVATSLSSSSYAFISLGIYIAIFLLFSLRTGVAALNGKIMAYIAVSSLFILFTTIATSDFHINHALIIFEMFQAAIVIHFVCYEDYLRIYVKIFTYLAAFSIAMLVLTNLFPAILSLARVVYNGQNVRFYNFILYFRSTNEGFRNYGIFTEPGDYQHYLNLALILYLYYFPDDEKKKWMPIVLTLTVLTTFSPAGLIVCGLIWISYILTYQKSFRKTAIAIIGVVAIIVIVYSIESLRDQLMNYTILKLTGTKTKSLDGRISGILSGLRCYIKSPLCGNGFTEGTEVMRQYMLSGGFDYHQTSTTTGFLAFFGLPLTIILTVPYIKAFLPRNASKASLIFVVIALLVSINNERYIWDLLYYVFLMYGVNSYITTKDSRNQIT